MASRPSPPVDVDAAVVARGDGANAAEDVAPTEEAQKALLLLKYTCILSTILLLVAILILILLLKATTTLTLNMARLNTSPTTSSMFPLQ